jgi:hypothetical protein
MTTDPIAETMSNLLYAATTDSMVPWTWLDESSGGWSMPPDERLKTLLHAVNGEPLPVRQWTRFVGAPLSAPLAWDTSMDDVAIPLPERVRLALRAALEAVISEPDKAVPEIVANTKKIVTGRVITVPDLSLQGERVIAHSIGGALSHALRLLIDSNEHRRLRKCHHGACGRFALVALPTTRGKPPKYFCSSEHRAEHRKGLWLDSTRAYRKGVTVAQYRRQQARKRGDKQ